jgi:glycosyltransferase involved in cell wall biosynthesis
MHVLIVTPWFYEPPRKKIGLMEVAKSLSESTRVTVVTALTEGALPYEKWDNLAIYRFKPWLYIRSLPYSIDPLLWLKLIKLCRWESVDVMIAVTDQFFTTFMAAVAKVFLRIPFVVWIHGSVLTSGRPLIDLIAGMYDKTAARFSIGVADQVFCLAPFLKFRAAELGAKADRVVVVPNGVDTGRFRPGPVDGRLRQTLGLDGQKVVTFSGRFFPIKGVKYLIQAAEIILAEQPDTVFLLLGDGPERPQLEAMGAEIDPSRFKFLGFRSDVPAILNLSDIFVLPSLSEGLSQAILEAYACGLPVVCTAVGGTPDLVRDAENGFLVEPRNSSSLAQRILTLLQQQSLAKRIGAYNRDFVVDNYSLEVVTSRVYSHLQALLPDVAFTCVK